MGCGRLAALNAPSQPNRPLLVGESRAPECSVDIQDLLEDVGRKLDAVLGDQLRDQSMGRKVDGLRWTVAWLVC